MAQTYSVKQRFSWRLSITLDQFNRKKAKYEEIDKNPRKLFKCQNIKTRLLKDFLIINSKLSKSDMIALNKKNDELFLPFVQHNGFPEDGEDAYKE